MSTEDTQEELKEEKDIEEATQDADTSLEEVVEEEPVDTPTYLRMTFGSRRALQLPN